MKEKIRILLVEDSPGDVRLTLEALKQSRSRTSVDVVTDGEAALNYLHRRPPYEDAGRPHLVLLDLNLPKRSGHEVLTEVKSGEALKSIPVLILSTSMHQGDISACYARHANAYIAKPVDFDRFIDVARAIDDFWLSSAVLCTK